MVYWETGSDKLEAFTGLGRRAPWLAVPMVICLVSLVGLPPFAGFIAKWWVLVALGSMGSVLGWILIVVAVINTLISLYYYMRIVRQMTLMDEEGRSAFTPPAPGVVIVNTCAALLLLLFIFSNPLKTSADRYARHLFVPQTTPEVQDDFVRAASFQDDPLLP